MRILFIADIVGRPGRNATRRYLEARGGEVDFVIANSENAAAGKGLTPDVADELFDAGVHALTGGNHTWRIREVENIIDDPRILRPANYPDQASPPGAGARVIHSEAGPSVAIVNLLGRTYMNHHEDPYDWAERLVKEVRRETPIILVDFHAEATSEKLAMFRLLDGEVSAVVGTHTHVQTADEQVSSRGTAYITDAGMTGAHDSILGVENDIILRQLRTQLPVRHRLASGDVHLSGAVIDIDVDSGRATAIERVFDPPRA